MYRIPEILMKDYDYSLPPDRIAQFPLKNRDSSKLLIWNNGRITQSFFSEIDQILPGKSLLVFNDTKVIPARLIFAKQTGATIEILCLEPIPSSGNPAEVLLMTGECHWKCLVGNVKRWKKGRLEKSIKNAGYQIPDAGCQMPDTRSPMPENRYRLTAEKGSDLGDGCFEIHFSWEPAHLSFSEILDLAGLIPLPPYITRASTSNDAIRYQTIYARNEGSVAAPTAGLHFSEPVLAKLRNKNIGIEHLTLHVGLGTFRPVSSDTASGHIMHSEKFSISADTILSLIAHLNDPVIAVGTTSVRTLESLFWAGVRLLAGESDVHQIHQWDPYRIDLSNNVPVKEALEALIHHLSEINLKIFTGTTRMMIVPGYNFRVVRGMITNFHLPQSTLLLLVAAFAGNSWKETYEYALENEFRFFSYGDACLYLKS